MIRQIGKYLGIMAILSMMIIALAWVTSPDLKLNPASFEDQPLEPGVAALEDATTLAQYKDDTGQIITIQVLDLAGDMVRGINLSALGPLPGDDPFNALTSAIMMSDAANSYPVIEIAIADLLPVAPRGTRHIGTGTNFPEHAEESNSDSVFQFPKFGPASPARSELPARPGLLLDYEVELCMRFDRDIISTADFDAAVKALFLCGDITNRNALIEMADPDDLDSGYGFSDAKSGTNSYPTGPFLVIPRDWKSFTDKLRMTTSVNDEPRQDARGAEMILDFKQLVDKALGDMAVSRFYYQGSYYKLASDNRIDTSTALMSGTSEGVIFTPPSRGDIIEGLIRYLRSGGPFGDTGLIDSVKQQYINNELDSGHFLQPGDIIRHDSNHLGNIVVRVTG